MDMWIHEHIHGVLWFVEILWVGGFLSVFVVYFIVRAKVKREKLAQQQSNIDEKNLG